MFPEFYISLAASDNRPSPLKLCEEALVTTGVYGIPVGTTGASLFRSADRRLPGRSWRKSLQRFRASGLAA